MRMQIEAVSCSSGFRFPWTLSKRRCSWPPALSQKYQGLKPAEKSRSLCPCWGHSEEREPGHGISLILLQFATPCSMKLAGKPGNQPELPSRGAAHLRRVPQVNVPSGDYITGSRAICINSSYTCLLPPKVLKAPAIYIYMFIYSISF